MKTFTKKFEDPVVLDCFPPEDTMDLMPDVDLPFQPLIRLDEKF